MSLNWKGFDTVFRHPFIGDSIACGRGIAGYPAGIQVQPFDQLGRRTVDQSDVEGFGEKTT